MAIFARWLKPYSAGAFGSPQLLQLSGVGNASDLSPLGIPVVADLPGVGENMQDHLEVYVQYGSKLPVSVAPALKWRNRPSVALRWALARVHPGHEWISAVEGEP